MRRLAALLVVATVAALSAAFALASGRESSSGAATIHCKARTRLTGWLTVGTDNPANSPWFAGGRPLRSPWKPNDPKTGQGFESALTYAIAKKLGISYIKVIWMDIQASRALEPGPRPYDFDINHFWYSAPRAKVVTFSNSYYDVNQALVVVEGTPIARADSVAGLRKFKLGARAGSAGYGYIKSKIKPSKQPAVFKTTKAAVTALKNKRIAGLVIDLPTAFHVTAGQLPHSKILGQFPARPGGPHFGLVFEKGDPFAGCVNRVLAALKKSGELKKLQQTWLAEAPDAPVLR